MQGLDLKLVKSLVFKGSSVATQLCSLFLTITAFDATDAVFWLTLQSVIQLAIPFVGVGLSQRLVRSDADIRIISKGVMARLVSSLGLTLGMTVFIPRSDAFSMVFWVYALHLTILVTCAEIVRARDDRHIGFVFYNLYTLSAAILFQFESPRSPVVLLVLSVVALGLSTKLIAGSDFFRVSKVFVATSESSSKGDILRAVSIALNTQFYSLVVWLGAYFFPADVFITVIAVFRFQILLNWPNFFWSRFAHRNIASIRGADFVAEHKRIYKVYLLGAMFCLLIIYLATTFASEYMSIWSEEVSVLVTFIFLRLIVNAFPPFDIFLTYQVWGREFDMWLLFCGLIVAMAVFFSGTLGSLIVYLLAIELSALAVRVSAWFVFRAQGVSRLS
jgi:hypothetical protein